MGVKTGIFLLALIVIVACLIILCGPLLWAIFKFVGGLIITMAVLGLVIAFVVYLALG